VNAHHAFRAPAIDRDVEPGAEPTFSVVIAAYQAAATVGEAVQSALIQSLPPLEVIVCDDGSTDGTAAALEPYREQIRYLRQEHRGVAATRNAALRIVRGEFFTVLDADDAFLPGRLEALAALSSARPDLDVLCTDLLFEVGGRAVGRFEETCPFDIDDQRAAVLDRCFCPHPAIRRTTLERVGGFDESMRTGEDWECAIRLIHSGANAGLVEEPLYRYRIHGDSLTADRVATLRERVRFLERIGQTQVLRDHERSVLARSVARHQASLAVAEAETALRSRARDARKRAFAAARNPLVPLRSRCAALAAALAPHAAARALERRGSGRF
jgi:glycosyltransferase involved in cell wall biosynthesis